MPSILRQRWPKTPLSKVIFDVNDAKEPYGYYKAKVSFNLLIEGVFSIGESSNSIFRVGTLARARYLWYDRG